MFKSQTVLVTALFAIASVPVFAQMPGSKVATVTATAKPASVKKGGKGMLAITITVAPHFHINAHKPNDPDLIPTTLTVAAAPGVTFGTANFPVTKSLKVSYEKLPMLVYQGKATILVPFMVAKSAKPGQKTLTGTVNYQGCNETSCFPPTDAPIKATVTVK